MAVITSYYEGSVLYNRKVSYDQIVGIDNSVSFNNIKPRGFYTIGDPAYSSVTNNLPIDIEPKATLTTSKYPTFFDDYYYRVHVNPNVLDLGNMLSSQSRNVEVWSAYFIDNTLTSITQNATDGITMLEPIAVPTVFNPLESRIYVFNITTNGPPILDADFMFNFASESVDLNVIGRRVVIWPFIPETGAKEGLNWKTDVIGCFSSEQRIALREAPRQSFSYEFLLDNSQFSRAKAITSQWAHRVYGIPVWSEISKIEATVSAGSSFIPFDTTYADYRDYDLVILWSSDTLQEALEINTVIPTGVNLKLPLISSWTNFYIAPLRFARTPSGIEFNRTSNKYIGASSKFEITQNKALPNEGSFPMYRGKVILTDRSAVVGGITERITRTVDTFDNGSGLIEIDIQNNWVRHLQEISFVKTTRQSIWQLRQWIHARRGKQKSFWLPSWNNDLEVVQTVSSAATAITVKPISYSLFYTVKDIMIKLLNGAEIYLRIMSASTDINGNEVLALSTSVGYDFNTTDVDFICFMSHCRLDTDQITINHIDNNHIETSIIVMETPE